MCYEHFAQLLIHVPSSKLGGDCPASAVSNIAKFTLEDHLNCRFGRVGYIKKYPIPTDAPESKGDLGMVIGFEPATPSNLLIYVPRTNAIVSRGHFTPVTDLTEFKLLMADRSKGATFDEGCISTMSEHTNHPTTVEDTNPFVELDDIEATINSLFDSSSIPGYNLSDLNRQMHVEPAIEFFWS